MLNTLLHQSSMQELDLLNPQLDPRISYTGGPKWYHGPDGLLRESPGNHVLWSEDFDNSLWDKIGASVTPDAAIGADGLLSMAKLIEDTSTGGHWLKQTFATPGYMAPYVFKGTAKAGERTHLAFGAGSGSSSFWNGGAVPSAVFDLVTGEIVSQTASVTYAAATLRSNGIWELEVRALSSDIAGTTNVAYQMVVAGSNVYAGNGTSGLYVGTAQYERATTASPYRRTTTAAVFDWPLEYDPITLEPLGRSVWEARTNLLTRSEEFSNAVWAKVGCLVTANARSAPDGAMTMDRMTASAGTSVTTLANTFAASVTTYALTVHVARDTYDYVWVGDRGDVAGIRSATFDLANGTVLGATNAISASIATLPNGIYRIELVYARANAGTGSANIALGNAAHTVDRPSNTWAGTEAIYIWGAQVEQAAFAGPYIPTAGSAVTRVKDTPDVPSINTVRFNQARGQSVLIEYQYDHGDDFGLLQVMDADAALDQDWLIYSNNSPDIFIARMYGGTGINGTHFGGSFGSVRGAPNKGVVAANQSGTGGSLNGAVPKSSTDCIPPASGLVSIRLGQLGAGSVPLNGHLRKLRFVPAKLSDAEQQAITA